MAVSRSAIVILGASGDLAKRKLIPALATLYEQGEIDSTNVIVGNGRTEYSDDDFRERFEISDEFAKMLFYYVGMKGLKDFVESKGRFDQIIIFMALPPSVYAQRAKELAEEGFGKEARIIIEKPFGYDYETARNLNEELHEVYDESQIFRIDHYLAKEAVQNILVFRFANSLFHSIWNSANIESIQISAFETIGVEDRGAYFDTAGIIRDMAQNHLMQLLCLMTMEAPVSLDAEEIRAQKVNVLKTISIDSVFRYQYDGYHQERGVAPGSTTETFAEIKLFINNFRWTGTPVYVRTGKALDRKGTEIGIRFKPLPRLLFNQEGRVQPNQIIFKIQPAEGIIMDLASKTPGSEHRLTQTAMKFCYEDEFDVEIPEAYQRLLLDALRGNKTLFVSAEETEMSWRKFGPFLDKGRIEHYRKGVPPETNFDIRWMNFEKYGSACE
jgi:glucose-6-phosphate 1-dehydrogenase